MTQLSQKSLRMFIDRVSATGSYKSAAEHTNISLGSFYGWRTRSKKDQESGNTSSPFYFDGRWFHEAVEEALGVFLFALELGEIPASSKTLRNFEPSHANGAAPSHDSAPNSTPQPKIEEWIPSDNPSPSASPPRASYAKPLRPQSELRAIAALTPEQRRAKFGASPFPLNALGQRTIPRGSPSLTDRADDAGLGLRPPVEPWHPPGSTLLSENGSYMPNPGSLRRAQSLDRGEEIGEGEPPPGGFRVA